MPARGVPPPTSHTTTTQWQSFEMRMRRRRAARCRLRATVALEAGFPDDAREALEEARRLDPSSPELADIETQIETRGVAAAGARMAAAYALQGWPAYRHGIAAALSLMTVVGVAAWLTGQSSATGSVPDAIQQVATVPALVPAVSAAESNMPVPVSDRVVAQQDEGAPAETTREEAREPEKRPDAEPRETKETREVPTLEPISAIPVAPAPPLPEPAADAGAPDVVPEPAPPVAQEPRVRSVLQRYEAAYSSLSVSAAQSVWPGVDTTALGRAFESLESQRVSLGSCDITVSGASARAECSGSASYTPKIGGGTRTEPRRWTFDLSQAGDDWQIVRATAR